MTIVSSPAKPPTHRDKAPPTYRDYLPGRDAWDTPSEMCPYCGTVCYAEFVNIGVGMQQVTPYRCDFCGAVQIGAYDCRCHMTKDDTSHDPTCRQANCDPRELRIGWYRPTMPEEPELLPIDDFIS